MAEVKSLGVHTPVALPYLITEGILPEDPKKDLYQWGIYVRDGHNGDIEEEVLATRQCVVWSQGKFIRNVYRFELEGEVVAQALLTEFPSTTTLRSDKSQRGAEPTNSNTPLPGRKEISGRDDGDLHETANEDSNSAPTTSNRALVVFLKTKLHIYFLDGSSHILDLPFEIEQAFPAPSGVILQRKISPLPPLPPTPQAPAAPPNSFFSPQLRVGSSFLQSPTLAKSLGSTQPSRPSPLNGNNRLDTLFQDVLGSSTQAAEDDLAPLYTLRSPLSDFGVVTFSLQHQKPRLSGKTAPALNVDFETLDAAEEMVYVSPGDELSKTEKHGQGSLMLIVTANNDLQTLTVWHAWYIEERILASLMKQRAAHKAAKSRRRSSFLSANMGTGTTTPAVRHREGTRESFAAAGSMRLPGEPAAAVSSRKPTRQEEEAAMTSQMDPDYQPTASQQNARESRRISSLNADVRASQGAANASFGGPGGRRNASFGGPNERRSLGYRRTRGSTPGSVFSRSLGPDDDMMDVDSSVDADGEETIEAIVRHFRATFEAAGADSLFGGVDGEFKRDLIVRKLHSSSVSSIASPARAVSRMRVVCQRDVHPLPDSEDQRLNVYIHDGSTKDLTRLQLLIKHRLLWPELATSAHIAVPVVTGEMKLGQCADIVRLKDVGTEFVLLADRGLLLSLDDQTPYPIQMDAAYRMYNPLDLILSRDRSNIDIGKNRTLQGPPRDTCALALSGGSGRFDEVGKDGVHHRRQMKLTPEEPHIEQCIGVCRLLLPVRQGQMVTRLFYIAYNLLLREPDRLAGTAESSEWVAFTTTIVVFVLHLIDDKSRAAVNLSRVAAGKGPTKQALQLKKQQRVHQLSRRSAWSWMEERRPSSSGAGVTDSSAKERQDQLLVIAAVLADEILQSAPQWLPSTESPAIDVSYAANLLLGLHVFNEEQKLCTLSSNGRQPSVVAAIIAQLGSLIGAVSWGFGSGQYYHHEGSSEENWTFIKSKASHAAHMPLMDEPVGVFEWFEHALNVRSSERYPSLDVIAALGTNSSLSKTFSKVASKLTPRIVVLSDMLSATEGLTKTPVETVELMAMQGLTGGMMETLPEAIAAPFREAIARCEKEPPTTWPAKLLSLVGREDLDVGVKDHLLLRPRAHMNTTSTPRDIHTVCHTLDHQPPGAKTREASRHEVSQLIFSEDRRLIEATSLMHFNSVQVAECPKQPDWTDAYHFEQQRRVMQWVTTRMIALPAGDAMLHFDCQTPLLTDKYHLPGFSSSCLMQPMGHTLTTDRSGLTEEKVNWAYFHAGVSAGLRISHNVKGIDTSWIAFNKPHELTNRHAGLLLALGLGGHLRHLAKWLSFKYLTPKHTMTSVGLLLGLSASYMGTMDGLITRMLSVHITRMLPSGAAELNVSPITQTAGLMGIGLLYYDTQHRRMSEIMLSELEHMELEDPNSGPDRLRDESYRLAAGFALGFINLGKGKDLRGLHGMYLPERLLAVAVGPRPVSAVHVFDRATAGAVVAIALVYLKSGDKSIARKVDIPDTEAQFDHVRPDMLMSRAMAKHLILWEHIEAKPAPVGVPQWTQENLPACYKSRFQEISASHGRHPLKSSDVPFFNIATGLIWALSLKYAGSGNIHARDEILTVMDYFYMIKGGADAFYYDAKLARSTVRRCIDVLALSAAVVMAGSGDLKTFRYLRRLHGRTDAETPYGSHLAAHLAIGALFLGGGTYTFGTSKLAIASLVCAFYALFPTDVHDNHVHLQAFRHFWVFAAEARCLVIEDIDTQRPISMPISVNMTDGSTKTFTAPCLLPSLDSISTIHTIDPAYWRVTLDFHSNPHHLPAFRQNQRIFVRRCPASEAHTSAFGATFAALNDARSAQAAGSQMWQSLFHLPIFKDLDKADLELVIPPDVHSSMHTDERGTVVDDRLALSTAPYARGVDELWNLRVLLAWAERATSEGDGRLRWIGNEVVEALRARVEQRLKFVSDMEG